MIKGHATAEGTKRFAGKFSGTLHPGHFREAQGLFFSSIGIGSYLGDSSDADDRLYEEALAESVRRGVNVIDSAINYRSQRSERSFGRALASLIGEGIIRRDEVIVCTKGGFIPFEENYPADPFRYFRQTYIEPGLLAEGDIVQGSHAMTPAFLEDQLGRSLRNLGLETIDVYYVHNPETQLADVDRRTFNERIRSVFFWLEEKVKEGKIRAYGTATWNGYRTGQGERDYLSLQDLSVFAREAGGTGHHFRFVQAPFNLAMPEAWVLPNQKYGAGVLPLLQAAEKLGLHVIASASLLQSRLTGPFPDFLDPHFTGLRQSSQRCLQFVRSVPGITTALVGMKQKRHVEENMKTAEVAPLTEADLLAMFEKA